MHLLFRATRSVWVMRRHFSILLEISLPLIPVLAHRWRQSSSLIRRPLAILRSRSIQNKLFFDSLEMINPWFEPARKETSGHFHVCGITSIHTPDVNQSIERYAVWAWFESNFYNFFGQKQSLLYFRKYFVRKVFLWKRKIYTIDLALGLVGPDSHLTWITY